MVGEVWVPLLPPPPLSLLGTQCVTTAVVLPAQCSRGCRRTSASFGLPLFPPCTFRNRRSLCDLPSPAWRCPASDLCTPQRPPCCRHRQCEQRVSETAAEIRAKKSDRGNNQIRRRTVTLRQHPIPTRWLRNIFAPCRPVWRPAPSSRLPDTQPNTYFISFHSC